MEQKDTKGGKGNRFWGRKDPKRSDDHQEVAEQLGNMEIETDSGSKKKGKNLDEWQPWNSARVIRIRDEELREFVEGLNKVKEDRAKVRIRLLLEELLGEKFQD